MRTYKLTLEYDGSRYSGWAEQINAPRTVMGELRKAAEKAFGMRVEIQGAGRTDAGVHALGQVAHIRVNLARPIPREEILARLNSELPYDIAVRVIDETPAQFHARHSALSRTYVYRISRRKTAFSKKFVWWVKEPLDVALMSQAAARLAGRHDFIAFRANDPARPDESTVVVIESADFEEKPDEDLLVFRIEASHFLWRMVRRIVGVLVKLGKHEITFGDFEKLLSGETGTKLEVAAWTAPASGLFLEKVRYPEKIGHPPVVKAKPPSRMRI